MVTWAGRAAALLIVTTSALTGCSGDDSAVPDDPVTVTATVTESASGSTPTPSVEATTKTGTGTEAGTETTEPPAGSTKAPRTYDEAMMHFTTALEADDIAQDLSRFETPTGNIYCVLDDGGIPPSCEIAEGGVRDEAECADDPSPIVGRLEFTETGAAAFCNSDTIRRSGAPILGYGGVASWTGLSIMCLVEEIGVTCVNTATAQGFFVARGRYRVFG